MREDVKNCSVRVRVGCQQPEHVEDRERERAVADGSSLRRDVPEWKITEFLLAGSNKYDLVLHSGAFNRVGEQHFLTSNLNHLTYCCAALCSFTEQKMK